MHPGYSPAMYRDGCGCGRVDATFVTCRPRAFRQRAFRQRAFRPRACYRLPCTGQGRDDPSGSQFAAESRACCVCLSGRAQGWRRGRTAGRCVAHMGCADVQPCAGALHRTSTYQDPGSRIGSYHGVRMHQGFGRGPERSCLFWPVPVPSRLARVLSGWQFHHFSR